MQVAGKVSLSCDSVGGIYMYEYQNTGLQIYMAAMGKRNAVAF
jgi:hypothetical protein